MHSYIIFLSTYYAIAFTCEDNNSNLKYELFFADFAISQFNGKFKTLGCYFLSLVLSQI